MTTRRASSLYLVLLLTSALFVSISSIATPGVHAAVLNVVLSAANGKSGDTITVTAWPTTEASCSITGSISGLVASYTATISAGNMLGSFVVGDAPAAAGGAPYSIVVNCPESGTVVDSGSAPFTVLPLITITPPIGVANQIISVTGVGFWSDAIACVLDGSAVVSAPTCSLGGGSMSGQFTVNPAAANGLYGITVTPNVGFAPVLGAFQKVAGPTIALSPNTSPPGYGTAGPAYMVIVSGGGFSPGSARGCTLSAPPPLFAGYPAWTCSISDAGAVVAAFAVSQSAGLGGYTVRVTDTSPAGVYAEATFTVTASPTINLAFPSGTAGLIVAVWSAATWFPASDVGACIMSSLPSGLFASSACFIGPAGALLSPPTQFVVSGTAPGRTYTVTVQGVHGDSSATVIFTVTAAVTLNPVFGSPVLGSIPGTTVTVTGTGFAVSDTSCTVTSAPNIISSLSCDVDGSTGVLSGSFVVAPLSTFGGYALTVRGTPALDAAPVVGFTVLPRLLLFPSSGSGGTAVSMSGSGFGGGVGPAPCAAVPPSVPPGLFAAAPVCTINPDGTIVGSFTVASPIPQGGYTVTVTGAGVGDTASASFGVGVAPTVILTPNFGSPPVSGSPGTAVTVSGSGFDTLDAGTCTITAPAAANLFSTFTCTITSSGSLSGQFTVGPTAQGAFAWVVTVTGSTGDFGTAAFNVFPKIVFVPNNGGSSAVISITGAGFNGADAGACAGGFASLPPGLGVGVVCSIAGAPTFQMTGSFTVAVPPIPGLYTVTYTWSVLGPVTTTFTKTTPTILLTPNSGSGGDTIAVSGSGFSTGDTGCTIAAPANVIEGTPSCSVSGGVVTGSFIIKAAGNPAAVLTNAIQVTGTLGDSAVATLTVVPKITLTPNTNVRVGSSMTLTGSNYAGGVANCNPAAFWPGISPDLVRISCAIDGATFLVTGTLRLVDVAASLSYTATLKATGVEASATLTVMPHIVTPNPTSGPIGASVSVTGNGYSLGDTFCGIFFDGVGPLGTCSMTSGSITGSFNVPPGPPPATYTITVFGDLGDFGSTQFLVTPAISLLPTSGRPGTDVLVSGSNFAAGDTGCLISSSPVGSATPVNLIVDPLCTVAGGAMSGTFTVASGTSGSYTVIVTGTTGDAGRASFLVPQPPNLVLTPNPAPEATVITASGSNYVGTTCMLTPTPSSLFTAHSCSIFAGTLTGSFTVAAGASGSYTVRVETNAGLGDSATTSFTVSAGPPPTLTLTPTSGPISTVVSGVATQFTTDVSCVLSAAPSIILSSPSCTITGGGKANIGFTVSPDALGGAYTIIVVGNTGKAASAPFTVITAASFSLSVAPDTLSLNQGGTGKVIVTIESMGGFNSPVTLATPSLPSGISGAFSSNPVTPPVGGTITSELTITVSATATVGTKVIAVTGTSAGLTNTGEVTLTVIGPQMFSLSTNPSTLVINRGSSASATVTVQSVGGFSAPVTLSAPGLPAGVSGGFTPNPVTPPAGATSSSVLTLSASFTATTGTTSITIAGTSGGVTVTTTLTIQVKTAAPKCIIATATFGSEASPAVQFLRSFRDSLVLSTRAGSAFMEVFNAWYYSFSPSVANVIANNDPLRAPIRVMLYPLLGILGLSSLAYSLFSWGPEFAVVMAGLLASSLIGLVYLTPFSYLGLRTIKKTKRIRTAHLARNSMIILALGLTLLAAGELAGSFELLALASSAIVLTCLIAVPTIAGLAMLRPKE